MAKISYELNDGSRQTLEIETGTSVRNAALDHGVPGIDGECGGFLNCATCHVYVDEPWIDRLTPMDEVEDELLDGAAAPRLHTSRLSCQLVVSEDWDGLLVRMPESQY